MMQVAAADGARGRGQEAGGEDAVPGGRSWLLPVDIKKGHGRNI
jgi:hypothetical protein